MKILFLTNLSGKFSGFRNIKDVTLQDCSGLGLDYPLSLLKELSNSARVEVYSPPLQGRSETAPLSEELMQKFGITFKQQTIFIPEQTDVEALMRGRDYDVVLVYAESMFSYMKNFEKIGERKVLWFLSSPHQILLPMYREYFEKNKLDLILKVADKENATEFGKEFMRLGLRTEWLPLSVDGNRFKKLGIPKLADICIMENVNPTVYPLRVRVVNYVLRLNKYRVMAQPCYGDDYVKAINYSRLFLTCSGDWKYPVMKYFESMACETLLLADTPVDAEELGFRADENFASIDNAYTPKVENPALPIKQEEWEFHGQALQQKLDHYLTHTEDRNRIARAGEVLVRARHTDEVRAKELFDILRTKL